MPDPRKRLHLGCGLNTPAGWIHLDGSWSARLAKHPALRRALRALHVLPAELLDAPWSPDILIHDIRERLPFPDNSLSVIYSSHTLEHLFREEATALLRECLRILEPGGVFRVVVPDLRTAVRAYLDHASHPNTAQTHEQGSPADWLCLALHFRDPASPQGNLLYRIYKHWDDLQLHKWMYDADSLTRYFQQTGFIEVQEMALHESRIEGIEQIEDPARVLDSAGVCIEGIKPALVPRL